MKMDLPSDLVEEILSRVPAISLKRLRSTCKRWDALFEDQHFTHKHLRNAYTKESLSLLLRDYRISSLNINLNVAPPSVEFKGALDIKDSYFCNSKQVDIVQFFHCDGLLLCVSKDNARLVVWNMCLGETRWIEPTRNNFQELVWYRYALGYDKSTESHRILKFIDHPIPEFKIYDFYSNSWRFLDLTPDWKVPYYFRGVTIRGNTYWFATNKYFRTRLFTKRNYSITRESDDAFLVSFDFTKESFGQRLSLPFKPLSFDTVSLSSVREEQLAVLFQPYDTLRLEIWVTTKIEPNALSWNKKVFLEVDLRPFFHPRFRFSQTAVSFFIDEEKKVAVVFNKDEKNKHMRNIAYIIGVDGSFKEVEVGGNADQHCVPLVCSYVPSLVQLN